ncbi:MAG: hypothetical protein F6K58_27620 [Symploca sp. SIO2E9]|nr:hypothetical protein [Symploca sp. SIO2E9]
MSNSTNSPNPTNQQSIFTKKNLFIFALILGSILGTAVIVGGGYLYLRITRSSISLEGDGSIIVNENNSSQSEQQRNSASEKGNAVGKVEGGSTVITGGIKADQGSEVVGRDKNTTTTEPRDNSPTINGNIENLTISYRDLPGYFPEEGFKVQPPKLGDFERSILLSNLLAGNDFLIRGTETILVSGKSYESPFRLQGFYPYGSQVVQRRVAFQLDGEQEAILLQFAISDLEAGDTKLAYSIDVKVDGELFWTGVCKYGTEKQIISVPLEIKGAKTLLIEYIVSDQAGYKKTRIPPLHLTQADILYKS